MIGGGHSIDPLKSSLEYEVKHLLIDFVIAQRSISVTDQSQSRLAASETSVPVITGKPVPAKMSGVLY